MFRMYFVAPFTLLVLSMVRCGIAQEPHGPYNDRVLTGKVAARAKELDDRYQAADRAGDYDEALRLQLELLELRTKALGKEHWDTSSQQWNADEARKVAALPPERQAAWRRAKAQRETARQLTDEGQAAQAEPLLREYLVACRELLGENHVAMAASYNSLGHNMSAQRRYAEAEQFFKKALSLYRELLGERHPSTATVYNNLGIALGNQKKWAEAQTHLQHALDVRLSIFGERHEGVVGVYENLAVAYDAQGRYAAAQPLTEKALDLRRETRGEKHVDTARCYRALALNLHKQGDFTGAQPLLRTALDLFLELRGPNDAATAGVLGNLATNLAAQGNHAAAQSFFERALDLTIRIRGDTQYATAAAYNELALNLNAQGKLAEAERLFEKACEIKLEVLGEEHASTALAYNNLALNLDDQGRLADAARMHERALALRLKLLGDQHPLTAQSYNNVATAWSEQRRHEEAYLYFQKALDIYTRTVGEDHPDKAQSEELSRLQSRRAQIESELTHVAVVRSGREVASLSQVQAALLADSALILWVDVTGRGAVEEHWGCVVRRTGDPIWEQLPGSGVDGQWTEDDVARPGNLREALASGDTKADEIHVMARELRAQRIAPLLRHLDGIQSLFVVAVTPMAGVPVELLADGFTVSYIPSGTFLARLPDSPATGSSTLLALGDPVFRPADQTQVDLKQLPSGGLFIKLVGPNSLAAAAGFKPGDVLLSYASVELDSIDVLTEAIRTETVRKQIPIVVWRDGVEFSRTVPPGPLGVILAKEPAPQAIVHRRRTHATLLTLRGDEWSELPGTRVEITQVAKLFGHDIRTLLDSEASEQSLERLRKNGDLTRFRYLHFATHGEANDKRAMESVLILAQDTLPETSLPRGGEPFLDGRLSAREVLDFWDLDGELVTLSACETALGRRGGGDGPLGFAHAFLAAGSRAACVSLWRVDDTATALLMMRFYQNLLGKRPGLNKRMAKATALAEAKRWLRDLSADEALRLSAAATSSVVRGRRGKGENLQLVVPGVEPQRQVAGETNPFMHPRYWSAFVLIGDPH